MKTFSQWLETLGGVYYDQNLEKKLWQIEKINKQFAEVMQRLPGIKFNVLFMGSDIDFSPTAQIVNRIANDLGMSLHDAITCLVYDMNFTNKFVQTRTAIMLPPTSWARIHRMCHGLISPQGPGRHFLNVMRDFFSIMDFFSMDSSSILSKIAIAKESQLG